MTRGVDGFKSERLKQALAARRMNQGQLAELASVSSSTVSKWCSGAQSPDAGGLERISGVLNLAPAWFTRPLPTRRLEPLYRSNALSLALARKKLEARLEWAEDISHQLEEFVDFPAVNIPVRDFTDPDQIDHEAIEHAAMECRETWRLGTGPIADLALAAESAGALLVREQTGITAIEGLSAWSDLLQRPIIFLSADKANAFRSRFDLAHELCHVVLHRYVGRSTDRERHNQVEKQAHRFAGALLLPAQTFAAEISLPVTLDNLLVLKQRWGVSVAAMLMRLEALNIIDEDAKANFFKRISARWGARSEPGDDRKRPEEPRLLRRSVELLVKSLMEGDTLPAHLGYASSDVEGLASLREGFFASPGRVLELATLRPGAQRAVADSERSATVVQFAAKRPSRD